MGFMTVSTVSGPISCKGKGVQERDIYIHICHFPIQYLGHSITKSSGSWRLIIDIAKIVSSGWCYVGRDSRQYSVGPKKP